MTDPSTGSGQALSYEAIELNREYGPWKYPLEERIARHLEAVENQHPWHHGRSPWGPPVAPPAILGNAAVRFLDQVGPVPPGTLHAKQEIETAAALRLDRKLIGYGKVSDRYEKRGRKWFTFESRWRDETGLIIGRSRLTMAFPTDPATTAEQAAKIKEQVDSPPMGVLKAITGTLTQEKMTAYSEDSANALRGQSIHVQREAAKRAGFPTTVAQGLMAADYISEMMEYELGKQWYEYAKLSLAFLRPVLCGDTLTANGRLAEAVKEGAVLRRVYEVWCQNQRGEPVAAGQACALVIPWK